ncbi:MAG: AMMECR1 domain-containing protein [Acidobacteriia bacterium]|nr:AMMECR1 domain-containing protein [Terriglobia bacterium]
MLLEQGILRRSQTQPVLSRDGTQARWMLDSLPVTLTPRGAELAGRLVLERLRRFDGRQLATFGLTAVPILQSAVLQSNGACHGLLVRSERKAHGSQKLIEGRIHPDEPTIMIEDSIASGTSVREGIAKLEEAGLRVEGCIALVRFGWEGGCSDLRERGYHVEAIYDIFADFMSRMEGERGPDYNPTKAFDGFRWSERRAPDGLHPAHLARQVLHEYFTSGAILLPPAHLDRTDYDSSGGAFVSVRSRDDIFDRHARDGFWHFPGEPRWGAAEDVVRAAFRTACEFPKKTSPQELLESSHIAVTFLSALERVTVGELDNDRCGIVVVSGERPEIMGGALPNMPGIRDEWQQFRHARYNNAALYPFEPYVIYRHEVSKHAEPGATWQPSGVAGDEEPADLGALAAWAREIACRREPDRPFEQPTLPATAAQIFVTVTIDGQVRGCMGSEIGELQTNLRELTEGALKDERFEDVTIDEDSSVAVSVSLLYNHLEMGDFAREEVRFRYRHGQQALMLEQGDREGMLLPFVAAWMSLDAEDFVDEVIDKAGVTRQPYNWRRFDCITWLADEDGVWKIDGGFKQCAPSLSVEDLARSHVDYLLRNQRPDGSLYFSYYPFENSRYQGIDVARQAHAAWTLARAGRKEAATMALQYVLNQADDPALALSRDAFVLLALCEPGMADVAGKTGLAEKLAASIDRHGRVATWVPPAVTAEETKNEEEDDADNEADEDNEQSAIAPEDLQNYVPGQVLLALAAAARTGIFLTSEPTVERAFRYYRHRFRYQRDFGQVSWITLAFAAWSLQSRKSAWGELVFEIADWILEFQHSKTGAFLTDHQPDPPGYTTAVYLEAVAAAIRVAAMFAANRRSGYEDSWRRGFQFLDRLIIQERDASVIPNPDYAAGGLRENLYSGHVRIDFVQHSLAAILERYPDISLNHPNNHEENQNGQEEKESQTDHRSCSAEEEKEEEARAGGRSSASDEKT